jgi:kynurenine formamidase
MAPDMWRYDASFPAFSAEPATSFDAQGFAVQRLTLSTHMGTHTDAPGHLIPGGAMIEAIPLEAFVGWARVLRVGPCQHLDAVDAARLAAAGGDLRAGEVALIETGWGPRWVEPGYERDHPYLTPDAAEWLIGRQVRLVGMDTAGLMDPRIDLGPAAGGASPVVDRMLLEAGIPYVAALHNLEALSSELPLFVGMPLKLVGQDGAPMRAVAIEDLGPSLREGAEKETV